MIHHRASKDIPAITSARPDLDDEFAKLIMDMLVRDRESRLLNAEDILDRLEALRDFPTMVNRGTLRTSGSAAIEATIIEPPSSKVIKARALSRTVRKNDEGTDAPSEAQTYEIVSEPKPKPIISATPRPGQPRPQARPQPRPQSRPQPRPRPRPPGLKEAPQAQPGEPPKKTNWIIIVFAVIGAISLICCLLMVLAASVGQP